VSLAFCGLETGPPWNRPRLLLCPFLICRSLRMWEISSGSDEMQYRAQLNMRIWALWPTLLKYKTCRKKCSRQQLAIQSGAEIHVFQCYARGTLIDKTDNILTAIIVLPSRPSTPSGVVANVYVWRYVLMYVELFNSLMYKHVLNFLCLFTYCNTSA